VNLSPVQLRKDVAFTDAGAVRSIVVLLRVSSDEDRRVVLAEVTAAMLLEETSSFTPCAHASI
jgi:hypothetical protein